MGLFSPPPTNGSSYPDIPPPDFVTAGHQIAQGVQQSGLLDGWVVKFWRELLEFGQVAIGFFVNAAEWITAQFVKALGNLQGNQSSGMFAMMAAVLGDLLGIEFDEGELIAAFQKGGRLKAMRTAGSWLYSTLAGEFSQNVGAAGIVPTNANAQSFLGFLIEFSVRMGNLTFLAELLPEEVNFLGGLREYGEALAKNLGLGRLARRALQPLVQTLVSDPLQWSLNAQYRPKLLAEAQYVKALNRGDLTRDQVNTWLSWMGYSDAAIEIVIQDSARPWQAHELLELARLGQMDDATAISLLQLQGIDQGTATQWWTAAKGQSVNSIVHRYIEDTLSQFRGGFVSWDTARASIAEAPILQEEKLWYYAILGDRGAKFWRHISEGEVERAFLGGILDMTSVQTYWQNLGYSPDSIQTLTFLLLQKQAASNKTRAGHVAHKHLSEAQLEKAYQGGVLDLAQLTAGWVNLGYSPADIEVLTALVTAKTPAPGATTLPGVTVP